MRRRTHNMSKRIQKKEKKIVRGRCLVYEEEDT
jgi:hypothetical protein